MIAGLGIAMLSSWMMTPELAAATVAAVLPDWILPSGERGGSGAQSSRFRTQGRELRFQRGDPPVAFFNRCGHGGSLEALRDMLGAIGIPRVDL